MVKVGSSGKGVVLVLRDKAETISAAFLSSAACSAVGICTSSIYLSWDSFSSLLKGSSSSSSFSEDDSPIVSSQLSLQLTQGDVVGVLAPTTTESGLFSFFQCCSVVSVNCSTSPCTGSPSKLSSKTQSDSWSSSSRVYQCHSTKSKANFLFHR